MYYSLCRIPKKKIIMPVAGVLLALGANATYAASVNGKALIAGCQELIAIYDRAGKKQFLASISTSVSEAMRAGICRGMVEEHTNHEFCKNSWYEMASIIAVQESGVNTERLLDKACGG